MHRDERPVVNVMFPKPMNGFYEGLRRSAQFSCTGQTYHPGPGHYLNWGSLSVNFWFTCKSGRTWKEAASIAKRCLIHMSPEGTEVETVYPERSYL